MCYKCAVMDFIRGISYNLRGLRLGIRTPRLLLLGMIRFALVIVMTVAAASVILMYHQEILAAIWTRPESLWIRWLWHLVSWLLSVILFAVATVVAYLVSQVLFAVVIMDTMSRMTEAMVSGQVAASGEMSFLKQLIFLVRQEIPRTVIPMLLLLVLTLFGWLTPLGPVVTLISSAVAAVFLAWDNTDLVPARRLQPFGLRFRFLRSTLPFHLGFGLLFFIPVLNVLCLSFAPVGATLFFLERHPDT